MLAIARVYFLPYVGNCYDGSVSGGVDGEEQENFFMMLRVMRLARNIYICTFLGGVDVLTRVYKT